MRTGRVAYIAGIAVRVKGPTVPEAFLSCFFNSGVQVVLLP